MPYDSVIVMVGWAPLLTGKNGNVGSLRLCDSETVDDQCLCLVCFGGYRNMVCAMRARHRAAFDFAAVPQLYHSSCMQ
jgi:hypothetical protein